MLPQHLGGGWNKNYFDTIVDIVTKSLIGRRPQDQSNLHYSAVIVNLRLLLIILIGEPFNFRVNATLKHNNLKNLAGADIMHDIFICSRMEICWRFQVGSFPKNCKYHNILLWMICWFCGDLSLFV